MLNKLKHAYKQHDMKLVLYCNFKNRNKTFPREWNKTSP